MKARLFQIPAIRLLAALMVVAVLLSPLLLGLGTGLPKFFGGKMVMIKWLEYNGHDVFVLKIPAEHDGWMPTRGEMVELWDSLIEMAGPEGWIYMFVVLETDEGLRMAYIATPDPALFPGDYHTEDVKVKLSYFYGAGMGDLMEAISYFEYQRTMYLAYYGLELPTPAWIVNLPDYKQGENDIVAWVMQWVYHLARYSEQPWAEELLYFATQEGG